MSLLMKVVRWLSIAVLGLGGLALMVAPALAQRELYAARGVDSGHVLSVPAAHTTAVPAAGSPLSPTPSEPSVGSARDLLGLALLILGLAVALHSRPRPQSEYAPHQ